MAFLGPDDVQHDMPVMYRRAHGTGEGELAWTSWTPGRLHVQTREGKWAAKLGTIAVLALKPPHDWAEFDHRDFDAASGTWENEGYYLQLRRRP